MRFNNWLPDTRLKHEEEAVIHGNFYPLIPLLSCWSVNAQQGGPARCDGSVLSSFSFVWPPWPLCLGWFLGRGTAEADAAGSSFFFCLFRYASIYPYLCYSNTSIISAKMCPELASTSVSVCCETKRSAVAIGVVTFLIRIILRINSFVFVLNWPFPPVRSFSPRYARANI